MNTRAKILIGLLFILSVFAIPAAAQPTITPTEGGNYALTEDLAENVSMDAGGTFTINMTDSTLTGDLSKLDTAGTLSVIMDDTSIVGGTISANGTGNIVSISGGTVTVANNSDTLNVENGGTVNLTNTSAGAGASNSSLISSQTGGSVNAVGSTLTGDLVNTGAGASAALELLINGGSSFTGAVSTNAGGTTNVTANERWNVTGNSGLGLGNLDNGGVVDYTSNTNYMTVSARDLGLNGATDGRFAMKMDIAAEEHDLLQIADTAAGSYTILTQVNNPAAATTGRERFNLVEIGGASDATFVLDNGNRIELGGWIYSLNETAFGTGTAWQVYSTGLSNSASAAVNTIAAGYLMSYAEINTLTQRLGELRDTPYLSGLWARVHGGKFSMDGVRFDEEFDLKYGGVQIGYDRKIANKWAGDLYVGVMFGYSKGDIDFDHASGGGDVDNKSLGIYGTYKQDDGFYLDAVLKYQWMNHEFNTFSPQGVKVTANDIDSGGIGASIEAGKRFEMKNSWYVEPQAQLSYQKQSGGTFNMSSGLRLGINDWTSLMGRIGARVGYESDTHNFYAKVSLVKEFDGDFDFKANGGGFRDSFDDNWWVYGIGYVSKINERNNLYLDIERASGGVFEQNWSIKAGWRLEF